MPEILTMMTLVLTLMSSQYAEASSVPVIETPQAYLETLGKDNPRALALMKEIIKRESEWQETVCNNGTNCGGGQGLVQVIPSTEKGCEAHFGREMDMLSYRDNLDCGWWLLTANGIERGIGHWDDFSWKRGVPKEWGSGPYYLENF